MYIVVILIYDPLLQNDGLILYDMTQNSTDVMSVFIQRSIGQTLLELANDNNTRLNISVDPISSDDGSRDLFFGTKSATIFIAASVCILICLCLSWILFYYCQRRRSRTAKDRLAVRLESAAKKALNKIPLKTVNEEPATEQTCVVCLESIKLNDVLRQLGKK